MTEASTTRQAYRLARIDNGPSAITSEAGDYPVRYTYGLSLSGLLSRKEFAGLSDALARDFPAPMGRTLQQRIAAGERTAFHDMTISSWKTPPDLPAHLETLLAELHLSYALRASPWVACRSWIRIVDREMDLDRRFALVEGEIAPDQIQPHSPEAALVARWGVLDEHPPLHIASSPHLVMQLAKRPGEQPRSVAAFLARQGR